MPFIAPVVGAIVGAVGAAASFIGGLGFVGKALIGIGLQLAANEIAKRKARKGQASGPRGAQLDVQYGAAEPRQIGVGIFATAGHDVFTNTFGEANKTVSKVFVLSDFPIAGVRRVAINGTWCSLTGNGNAQRGHGVTGDADGFLWIKIHRGLPGQSADPFLVSTSRPGGRWMADHRGEGIAYAVVHADYDDEKMSSFPQLLFECDGLAYDPRRDSTVGGSGAQRFADVTTWAASENPIVQAYTYCRGFFTQGELMLGKGMPAADLPLAAWMAAMSVCDEGVQGEARYRSGFIFTGADGVTHKDNLEHVLNAAAAALVERVDGDLPLVGATQPVVATLSDDDLIVGEAVRFQAKRSRASLINAVHGSFNKPADLWAASAYPAQRDEGALAADRERHAVQIDFRAVSSERQATTLAAIALRENRYQASASVVVRPRWIALEIGDWIRWDLRGHGLRTWRVVGRTLGALGPGGARNVSLDLEEVGPGIYDVSVVVPEGPVRVPPEGPIYVSTVSNFLAIATTTEAATGRSIPAIRVQWDAIEDLTVDAVIVQYWKEGEEDDRAEFRVEMPAVRGLIAGTLLPRTRYRLRARVLSTPPRAALWSVTREVMTGAEDLAVELESLDGSVRDLLANGVQGQDRLLAIIDEVANAVAVSAAQGKIENGEAVARIMREEVARVEENRVLAALMEGVRAELYDPETGLPSVATAVLSLLSEVESLGGDVTAVAEALLGVGASLGELSADGLIRFEARAGDGASSRIAILARADQGDGWQETGFMIEVGPGGSMVLVLSDRFVVTDGTTTVHPFVIEEGIVKLTVGRFQQFVSDNGKMVIDGTAGTISIYD